MSLLLLFRPRTGAVVTADPVTPDIFVLVPASVRTVQIPLIASVTIPVVGYTVTAPDVQRVIVPDLVSTTEL